MSAETGPAASQVHFRCNKSKESPQERNQELRIRRKEQEQNEETLVNGYESSVSRVACGIAAVAMTAITIGVAVVMPAKMESDSHEPLDVAASKVPPLVVADIITDSATINVVAVRTQRLSAVPCVSSRGKPNPDSRVRRSLSCSHAAR